MSRWKRYTTRSRVRRCNIGYQSLLSATKAARQRLNCIARSTLTG
uniref:Uncharacterized protein n=1 Tax=Salmonella phage PMBT19 TaxID=3229743 RepID=A0AB39C2T5_9CAUD